MGSPSVRPSPGHQDNVPFFRYSDEDVTSCLARGPGLDSAHSSKLDQLLFSSWDRKVCRGDVFRYTLDGVTTRVIDGRYGLVAQRNPKRFSHRRKPMDMQTLTQPFDSTQFNFNKIRQEEILLKISRRKNSIGGTPVSTESGEEEPCHLIIVNVSPIDYGHVLLVPNHNSCLPQVMTEDSIRLCLDIMALSSHSGFCMVANSMLAYASVNHLHYHFMCVAEPMLAARVSGKHLGQSCYELLDHPCRGFGFELNSSTSDCAKDIYKAVSLLLESDLPHNMVMIRGPSFSGQWQPVEQGDTHTANAGDNTSTVIRTLLVPRKPAYGLKNLYEGEGDVPPFFAAACELVLGLLPIVDQSAYHTLTESEVLSIYNEKSLSSEEFEPLNEKFKQLLHS